MIFRYDANTEREISSLRQLDTKRKFRAQQRSARRFAMSIKALQLLGLGILVTLGSILIANISAIVVEMFY